MLKSQKPKEVEALKERFQKAKSIIFAENKGLRVTEVTSLRKQLRQNKASMKVVKNRLVKRALKEAAIVGLDSYFVGPVTIFSSDVDPVISAKVVVDFIKNLEEERLVLKGGYFSGGALTVERVKALASLPSREELLAKLMGCLNAPVTNLVYALSALPKKLVYAIDAIRKQKE